MEKIQKGDLVKITSSIRSVHKSKTYICKGDMGIALSSSSNTSKPNGIISVMIEGRIWGIPATSIKKITSV